MFIENLNIHSYKMLNEIELSFKKTSYKYFNDLNLTILVGENGTGKSSILQLLTHIFCPSERKSHEIHEMNFTISYRMKDKSDKVYTYSHDMDYPVNYPKKLIVSSFFIFDPFRNSSYVRNHFTTEHIQEETKYVYGGPSVGGYSSLDTIIHPIIKALFIEDEDIKIKRYASLLDKVGCQRLLSLEINRRKVRDYLYGRSPYRFSQEKMEIINEYNEKINQFRRVKKSPKYRSGHILVDVSDIDRDFLNLYEKMLDIKVDPGIKDIIFVNSNGNEIPLSTMSSGEITLLFRFAPLIVEIEDNSLILIDEPETHLHPAWIQEFIQNLLEFFEGYNTHFIIATHSPLIASDVPSECVIGLKKEKDGIKKYIPASRTLGGHSNDILKNVFRLNQQSGDFSMNKIERVANLLNKGDEESIDEAKKIYKDLSSTYEKFQIYEKYRDLLRG
ncbi:AAA family ATPase [Priestia sp. LL-8]|uniref:AAA family ATPase n=1 Tax=Priestia sp. LL-8 TaxID=3110068 RepID=UPI002E2765CC|nr:AAA family ATPase [Priestia sp. LL-8]